MPNPAPTNRQMRPSHTPKATLEQLARNHNETIKKINDLEAHLSLVDFQITQIVGIPQSEGTLCRSTPAHKVTARRTITREIEIHDPKFWRNELGAEFDNLLTEKVTLKAAGFMKASQEVKNKIMEHLVIKSEKVAVIVEPNEAH